MKYQIFNLSLALLFLTMFSCKKQFQETKMPDSVNETQLLSEMDLYLLEFKQKMDNPHKTSEMLSLEDARWHLSATLNFMYADAKMDYELLATDTLNFILPLINGQIALDDFSNAFYEVTDFLSARYQKIETTDKTLNLVSINITSQSDEEVEIMAVSLMGYNPGLSWGYPFSEGHWWYWGWELGRCGSYEGQNIGLDAAKKLTFAANIVVPVPGPGRVYWTDELTRSVYAIDHPDGNSPSGYLLFHSDIPINEWNPNYQYPCLTPDDMNYYFPNILAFGQQLKPSGKTLINYYVNGTFFMFNYQSYPTHILSINYGIPHVSGSPPNEL